MSIWDHYEPPQETDWRTIQHKRSNVETLEVGDVIRSFNGQVRDMSPDDTDVVKSINGLSVQLESHEGKFHIRGLILVRKK